MTFNSVQKLSPYDNNVIVFFFFSYYGMELLFYIRAMVTAFAD